MKDTSVSKRLAQIIRIFSWLAGIASAGFVLWIFYANLSPNGLLKIHYNVSPSAPPALLQHFASKEDARLIGQVGDGAKTDFFQEITKDPLYFSIPAPRSWESATVRVLYDNPDFQPIMKLGIERGNNRYAFFPLATYHQSIENLEPFWVPFRDGSAVLWQKDKNRYQFYLENKDRIEREARRDAIPALRETDPLTPAVQKKVADALAKIDYSTVMASTPQYATVEDFVARPPDSDKIVLWNKALPNSERYPNYQKSENRREIKTGLRGSHTIVAYAGEGENLDFQFFFRDINRHADDDRVAVAVSYLGKEIYSTLVEDDGIHVASGQVLPEREYRLSVPSHGIGSYKISLKTTDDTFVTRLTTQQHLFYFEGHIYLADSSEYRDIFPVANTSPVKIYTDAGTLIASTSHESGKQKLVVGKKPLLIDAIHDEKRISDLAGKTSVLVETSDISLGGGAFGFLPEDLFQNDIERPVSLDQLPRALNDYDFLFAEYAEVLETKGLFEATATVPPSQLSKSNGSYEFILNMPGLSENHRRIHIYELDVTFHREPVTLSNFMPRLGRLIQKIFHSIR